MLKIFNIESRRYIGSKAKLLESIVNIIPKGAKVFDAFGGTGVVTAALLKRGHEVYVNDMLFSNYLVYKAFFSNELFSRSKIENIINDFNNQEVLQENYASKNYGNKYFSLNTARKIGHIRESIDIMLSANEINKAESEILIVSLLYSMDRYANTVGHYEMYLKNVEFEDKQFVMGIIDLSMRNSKVKFFNQDANELAHELANDIQVVYIDPPYNARQYVNFYHVWENIAKWEKPELKWESMKFDRTGQKSKYSTSSAKVEFAKLVSDFESVNLLVTSYNNTYKANSEASNNKIKEVEIKEILSAKRKLQIIELEHKFFNAGKTNFVEHKEYLYLSAK